MRRRLTSALLAAVLDGIRQTGSVPAACRRAAGGSDPGRRLETAVRARMRRDPSFGEAVSAAVDDYQATLAVRERQSVLAAARASRSMSATTAL